MGHGAVQVYRHQHGRHRIHNVLQVRTHALQGVFIFTPLEYAPHAFHKKRQLAHIGFVVGGFFIADTRYNNNAPLVKNRDIHVSANADVSFGVSFFLLVRRFIVVGNHGCALPNGFAPKPCVFDGIQYGFVLNSAFLHRGARPGVHAQHRFVLIHEGKIANGAVCQPHRFLKREIGEFLRGCLGHLAEFQQRLKAHFVKVAGLFRLLAFRQVHKGDDIQVAEYGGMHIHLFY
ncbi:MAG: hypothetical protein BWX80_03518 [Candidatus Hydrogenedentes bacterium ADurb.Bin101]|nr:MAG: hypothetical protein BWX80_03518 [Candidatus Hydrogenedentes bacterium ADurb.Bin101]